jgi:TPR repeat protein
MKPGFAILFFTLNLAMPVAYADVFEKDFSALEGFEFKKELKHNKPLAKKGDVVAQVKLGYMYMRGMGAEQDIETALKWFHKAAEQGNAEAAYRLGDIYGYNQPGGFQANHEEAVKWYRRAAEQGYTNAQYSLAARYFDGNEGLPKDRIASYAWMHIAARQGHHSAAEKLDLMEMIMNEEELSRARKLADELAIKYSPKELQY